MSADGLKIADQEELLNDAIVAYFEAVEAGQTPDPALWQSRYPELADKLREFFADQVKVRHWTDPLRPVAEAARLESQLESRLKPDKAGTPTAVGDYELLGQIGEGGMGLVYKARQKSLKRTVALKMIRADRLASAAEVRRFRTEAELVACLDHPNIVPIHEVGEHDGRLYFSMKLVEGGSLADCLPVRGAGSQPASAENPENTPANSRLESSSTIANPRAAAQLMIVVARAVHHAHQRGILHRDLKPSNVLLDDQGRPHVTDFGLAKRVSADSSLTQSGQLVGTPSYMAPEQAAATKDPLTTAADVYGLGAILYALLTGRPPFRAETVLDTLQQVKESEPQRPRSINPQVSRDLETISLKCLRKEPAGRYGSAEALAEDLESFLEGKPIQARPINRLVRLGRWCRRHKPLVLGLGMPLLTVLAIGGIALWSEERQRAATAQAVVEDLKEAEFLRAEERWAKAVVALERARGRLEGSGLDSLQARVEGRRREVALVALLDDAHLQALAVSSDGKFDFPGADHSFGAAFAKHGLDIGAIPAEETARQVRSSDIRNQLVTALDNWAWVKERLPKGDGEPLRAIAGLADDDPWRQRLRDARLMRNRMALERLAEENNVLAQPRANLLLLSRLLFGANARAAGALLLREAQRRHPADFWINFMLAWQLDRDRATVAEAIGYYRAALALQPENPTVHHNLGGALHLHKMFTEAEAAYRKAIDLQPRYALAYYGLGEALSEQQRFPEAEAAYHKAIDLNSADPDSYNSLGIVLRSQRKLPEAEAAFRKLIQLKPEDPNAHNNLGALLCDDKGDFEGAVRAFREAIRLKPAYPEAHRNLGIALSKKGMTDDAIVHHREAIRLKPDFAEAHNSLGVALFEKGMMDEAIVHFREAIRLKPDYALAHNNLRFPLSKKGMTDAALSHYREAIRLKPNSAEAHHELGVALGKKGMTEEAITHFREAIRFKPDFAEAHGNLGTALDKQGMTDEAITHFREAIRLKGPDLAEAQFGLGRALKRKGLADEAVAAYEEAIRLKPDYPEAHCNLGLLLNDQGRFVDGLAALKRGHQLGSKDPGWPYPSAEWVRQAEQFVLLDAKLPGILKGETLPTGAAERVALARLCQLRCRQLYAAAVVFYSDAFAAEPKLANDLSTSNRYEAACAAALAGCGQGKETAELEGKEHARLRGQALAWLRADLTAWRLVLEKSDNARPRVQQQMEHWQQDTDFDGVRGTAALAKLPEAERQEWRKLWQEVEALGRRAAEPK